MQFVTAAAPRPGRRRGHVVGWEQFALPGRARPPQRVHAEGAVDLAGDVVAAGSTMVTFDRAEGVLASIVSRARRWCTAGPRLALWRAPTDNDGLKLFLGRTDGWTEE